MLGDEWRPDISNVLIRIDNNDSGVGLILQPLVDPFDTLTSEDVIDFLGGCVSNNLPVYISVPTKPGYSNAIVKLNHPLAASVVTQDLQLARSTLTSLIKFAQKAKTLPNSA